MAEEEQGQVNEVLHWPKRAISHCNHCPTKYGCRLPPPLSPTTLHPSAAVRAQDLRAQLEAMSPQERTAVRAAAVEQLLRMRRTRVGGKVVSLKQLRDRVARMREDYDRGVYDETIRLERS